MSYAIVVCSPKFLLLLVLGLSGCGSSQEPQAIKSPAMRIFETGVEPPAHAHKQRAMAGIAMDVPWGWKESADGHVVSFLSPDSELIVVALEVEASSLAEAFGGVAEVIATSVQGARLNSTLQGKVNGMPALFVDGQGEVDGAPVALGLVTVLTPGGRGLVLLGIASAKASETSHRQAELILHSIEPR